MKFNKVLAATASLLAGAAMAAPVVYPGGDLGPLTSFPSLYGDLLATGVAGGGTFTDSFSFTVGAKTDVIGSLGAAFGSVSFTSILVDGVAAKAGPKAGDFYSLSLGAGKHTLSIAGTYAVGANAYVGSLYGNPGGRSTVPEPETLALALAGVGIAGTVARRRSQQRA